MKTPATLLLLAVAGFLLLVALAARPPSSVSADLPAGVAEDIETNPWIVWEALNIFGEIFVDRQSILTTEECTCRYSCGGLCPPCTAVRRAQMMGPFCSEAEAWATICSRMTDRGRFVIGSPCPWWVVVDGVRHTVDWNPWATCPQIGAEVVIPRPTCELPPPTATVTPTPTPTPEADWDIAVRAVEWTQAIQCLADGDGDEACAENSIPLVHDKPAVIRAYPTITVRQGRQPEDGDCVTGLLSLAGQEDDPLVPLDPCVSLNLEAHGSPGRGDWDSSLNFLLPPEWTARSSLQLKLELGSPDEAITDTNEANNVRQLPLVLQEQPRLSVLFVPVKCCGIVITDLPSPRMMREGAKNLLDYYPLAEPDYSYHFAPYLRLWVAPQGSNDRLLLYLLNKAYSDLRKANPAGAPDQVFAWLPADLEGFGFLGASDPAWFSPPGQGRASYARTRSSWEGGTFLPGRLLAHEMGHNLGLFHVPTDDACGAERFAPLKDWPYSSAYIQEYGFFASLSALARTSRGMIMDGLLDKDIMTYCSDDPYTWVSPHTYKKLLTGLHGLRRAPLLEAAQEYLLISGFVTRAGGGGIETVERLATTDTPSAPAPGSDFCLELQDGAGGLLSRTCFDSWFTSQRGDALTEAGFFFILPAPSGTQRVALTHEAVVIDTRSASAHAPQVSISAPAPGAVWNGRQTIRWSASDADGDALTYSLLYSHDGSAWLPLDIGLSATSYELDMSELPGGNQARLKVSANDGFHTTDAEAGPFSVARKPPFVAIEAPADGARFRVGERISLQGSGDDPEDGSLPGSALAWHSAIAGDLGTGALLQTGALGRGDHRITLTARDAHGMTASAAITLQLRLYQVELPIITKNALPVLPSATPAPCDLLFSDSFSGGGLVGWQASGGEWSNAGGYMAARSGALISAWGLRSISAGNMSYEGTVTLRSGTSLGLSFGKTTTNTTGYDLVIDIYESRLKLVKQPNSKLLGAYSFAVQRDRPYRLRVDVRNGVFDIYLDGALVLRAADGAYLSGKPGVVAYNSSAEFDDLRACSLSASYEVRVNAGGGVYTDTQGIAWFEDQAYSAGGWGWESSSLVWTGSDPVAGTVDDTLYQSGRWAFANFSYKFSVPNGRYQVRLLFSEPYYTQAGKRTFDVQIEGQAVLSNLDLFAVAGHDNAYNRTFNALVSDGQLTVTFVRKIDTPFVNAVEVVGQAAATATGTHAATATPSRTITRTPSATATRTATAAAIATGTPSRTPSATATRTPTQPAWTVRLLQGDVRSFSRKPAVSAYANRLYVSPPAGVTITDSGNVSPYAQWVFLMSAGQWIEASYSGGSTAIGVQFWGDNSDGWARVLVDGVEAWAGSTYAPIGETYMKYLEVSGLPAGVHHLRVECMGINGAGGYDDVALLLFGFGNTPVQP